MKKLLYIALTLLLFGSGITTLQAKPQGSKPGSPFLINGKLPHYTMKLKMMWDDPVLALTPKQKQALLVVRKETIGAIKNLKPQIMQLERKIVKATKSGIKPATLKKDVDALASLKAKATMVHLRCIYKTRQILSPKQLRLLQRGPAK